MDGFGESVRSARLARGWTQGELARRVGVSQRAVSSWERAVSEPDELVQRQVVAELGLPPSVLGAGNDARLPRTRRYPHRPLLHELPLDLLNPLEFENFAADLIGALRPDVERPSRRGGPGHKQHGYDVTALAQGRVQVGVQCKQVKRFGPAEVRRAIAAAELPVEESFIFLSRIARPPALDEMRVHKGWQLWDQLVLSQAVRSLPLRLAANIIDRYFPELRHDFLGLPLPGPWIEPERYFSRVARSELYSHRWQMVGRDQELDDLAAFAAAGGGKVGLLVGRGGLGKTRLLSALCDRLSAGHGPSAVFLDRDPEFDARAFELLPEGELLVIVDDAHDDGVPVAKVITGVHEVNPDATVLLALRPHGEPQLGHELRIAGVDPRDAFRRELGDLEMADAEALAREALGDRAAHYALRLAGTAYDCPLLLVAGADLIRQGKLHPARFEGDASLSANLIEAITGAVIDEMASQSADRAEVLHAVAALQPLRTADPEFHDALVALTGRPYDQVAPHLAKLEDSGILLRRAETYRVVPDLLGDWLLARRSHTSGGTASTRYIDRVHHAAGGAALANLIVNAGRMDWQRNGAAAGLLDGLWSAIHADFEAGGEETRGTVLGVLAKVAFFQPAPCLAIVRLAVDRPARPEPTRTSSALLEQLAVWRMRDALCQVLRGVAHRPEYLREAAGFLWQMAGDDPRPPSHHQHHPIRILAELAAFQPAGPTEYQRLLLGCVEQWASLPRSGARDPLEVLLPMLAPEGHLEAWLPRAISFRPFLLNPDAGPVAELRARVLDLAFTQLAAGDARRALAALNVISAALSPPHDWFGMKVTSEQRSAWIPGFVRTLGRLEQALRNLPSMNPVLAVTVRSQLQAAAEGPPEVRAACSGVFSALPSGLPYSLARALHGGPADPPADLDSAADLQYRQKALEDMFVDAITDLAGLSVQQAVMNIEHALRSAEELLNGDPVRARPFLSALVSARPALAAAIAGHVSAEPGSLLTGQTVVILTALAATGNPDTVPIARRFLDVGDTQLSRQVGLAFGIQRGRIGQLLPGESELLRALVAHDDAAVHAAALGALRPLGPQHKELVARLLSDAPPERPGFAWWEVAGAAGPAGRAWGTLSWAELPDDYKDRFFRALATAANIENYETSQLLVQLSRDEPYRVVRLLTARIERAEHGTLDGYSPLPRHWPEKLTFRENDAFPDILHYLYRWLADAPDSAQRRHYGSELFILAAGAFDVEVRSVIDRYLDDPDPARMMALAAVLDSAPQSAVWDISFVRRCLQASGQCGAESLSAVQGALHRAIVTAENQGIFGGPTERAAQRQQEAGRLAEQCPSGSREEAFYRAVAKSAEAWAGRGADDWDALLDGRQW